jgi:hypothetical protein
MENVGPEGQRVLPRIGLVWLVNQKCRVSFPYRERPTTIAGLTTTYDLSSIFLLTGTIPYGGLSWLTAIWLWPLHFPPFFQKWQHF